MSDHLRAAIKHGLLFAHSCLAPPPANEPAVSPVLTVKQAVDLNELILKELKKMSDSFDVEMAALKDDVQAQAGVIASAITAFKGVGDQLAAAIADAKSKGATDDQTAAMAALRSGLEANTASLVNAIVAPGTEPPAGAPAPATDPNAAS